MVPGRIILLAMKNIEFDASASFKSPIGAISLFSRGNKIVKIELGGRAATKKGSASVLEHAQKQLTDYFTGKSKVLDFAVEVHGTEFQEAVWRTIDKIKFGKTLSYGDIAAKIGSPAAVRAVGGAVGANPVPIRIGCHRVLGSSGTITGYSGGNGIPTKRQLLALENIEAKG
jgi:methylated-DNA-[protein]-cysteine S-methyltransferase